MREKLGRGRLTLTLSGLGFLALGLAVLLNPIGALEDGVSMVGWILVIVGALTVLASVLQGGLPPRGREWVDIVVAALEVVPGIVMVAAPGLLVDAIWTILGLYVVVAGVHVIAEAATVGPRIAGGFVCALGVATIAAAAAGPVFGMLVACLVLMVTGIIELVCGLAMQTR